MTCHHLDPLSPSRHVAVQRSTVPPAVRAMDEGERHNMSPIRRTKSGIESRTSARIEEVVHTLGERLG
jgi:hypothetical protein